MKQPILLLLLLCLAAGKAYAQPDIADGTTTDSTGSAPSASSLNIFLNCVHTRCYDDYVRTELSFFNFVRDRYVSDVEILVVNQPTGAGGRQYTLTFFGQKRFQNLKDTLTFSSRQTDTDDMIRQQLVLHMQRGLLRYVMAGDLISQVQISYPKRRPQHNPTALQPDRWNFWVFNIGSNGSANGESNRNYLNISNHVQISRVTASSKFNLYTYYNQNRSRYMLNGEDILVRNIGYGFSSLFVKGFSEHWSAGGFMRGYHSVFQNINFSQSVAPALEYSVFPLSQVTRRQLRWIYQAGLRKLLYLEPTIYDKSQETLPYHQITGIFGITEPWGTLRAELSGYQYLHDLTKNRLTVEMDLAWRVMEGLFFRINGSASLINNQISLARSTINTEDALLNGRQLPTNFNYYSSIGLSFTFGSINNSVVNPRFSGVD
ncbi:hypothetical protein [Nibrella viscosa]